MFDWLDQEVAKKMATRGILHQFYRDFIEKNFWLSEEETEELYEYSEKQLETIRKNELEKEKSELFENEEKKRSNRF